MPTTREREMASAGHTPRRRRGTTIARVRGGEPPAAATMEGAAATRGRTGDPPTTEEITGRGERGRRPPAMAKACTKVDVNYKRSLGSSYIERRSPSGVGPMPTSAFRTKGTQLGKLHGTRLGMARNGAKMECSRSGPGGESRRKRGDPAQSHIRAEKRKTVQQHSIPQQSGEKDAAQIGVHPQRETEVHEGPVAVQDRPQQVLLVNADKAITLEVLPVSNGGAFMAMEGAPIQLQEQYANNGLNDEGADRETQHLGHTDIDMG